MDRRRQRAGSSAQDAGREFLLYIEGPRDREILRTWARRAWPEVARAVEQRSIILGGRQPARAASHFRLQCEKGATRRGLCVLDRDAENGDGSVDALQLDAPAGLEFFVWPRRHIESYLLDWAPIERCLRGRMPDARTLSALRTLLPGQDSAVIDHLDAKRLLSPRGTVAELLSFELRPSQIAKAMQPDELHLDIETLFERIRDGLGLRGEGPEVVVRAGGGS